MTTRQCNSCTACCEGWIKGKINGVEMSPYKPCEFCTDTGCAIYENRPAVPCVSFKCGWLMEESPLPDSMNPVECGAIVVFDRKWVGASTIYALPTGAQVPGETLDWLMAYSREQSIPLIWYENLSSDGKLTGVKQFGYGPPSFVEAVRNALQPEDIFMF